jgi:hypothetical protein
LKSSSLANGLLSYTQTCQGFVHFKSNIRLMGGMGLIRAMFWGRVLGFRWGWENGLSPSYITVETFRFFLLYSQHWICILQTKKQEATVSMDRNRFKRRSMFQTCKFKYNSHNPPFLIYKFLINSLWVTCHDHPKRRMMNLVSSLWWRVFFKNVFLYKNISK